MSAHAQHGVFPSRLLLLIARSSSSAGGVMQVLVSHIISQEPLIGDSKRPLLWQLLQRLIEKQVEPQCTHYDLVKVGSSGVRRVVETSATSTPAVANGW